MLQKSGIPKLFLKMKGMKGSSYKIDRFNGTSWTCTNGGPDLWFLIIYFYLEETSFLQTIILGGYSAFQHPF